jgi:hypothetical protein
MVAQVTAELITEAVVMALDQLEVQVTAVVLVLAMDLLPELTELTGEQLTVPDQDQLEALQMAVALTVLEARAVVQLVVQLAVQAQAVEAAVALAETRVAAEQSHPLAQWTICQQASQQKLLLIQTLSAGMC